MNGFDKREEGFESRFAHENEMEFKVRARRNKLLGLWIAVKKQLSAEKSVQYADELVQLGIVHKNDDKFIATLLEGLGDSGLGLDEATLYRQLALFFDQARLELGNKGS